ncbi:MAG: hypothetical protein ACJ72O_02600 [Marmoricola sp.]
MGIFRRRARKAVEQPVSIVIDQAGARRLFRGEVTHHVRWDDLEQVAIRTTDDGPFAEDLFWVLLGRWGSGFVVPAGLVPDGFLARLQQLPGFDNEAVTDAMQSIDDAVFVAWRK